VGESCGEGSEVERFGMGGRGIRGARVCSVSNIKPDRRDASGCLCLLQCVMWMLSCLCCERDVFFIKTAPPIWQSTALRMSCG
jgi:hypothetical protein